ncbi:cytochrome P450 [Sphingomonas sp. DBB INV C78]|uniref:cytochrome P450 n=1 Tax=Sphingomonas sp. DBB INV C78 TaxID=3349434 RepID=UPI0036D2DCDA
MSEPVSHAMEDVRTPARGFAPLAALLTGQRLPAIAARLGIALARRRGRPWRLFKTVIVARHADVAEALRRDVDFIIAPVNEAKIEAVNGPFVLGMDRSDRLERERHALYAALQEVDVAALAARMRERMNNRLAGLGENFDAISDYARPLAAATAMDLFGIAPKDEALFAEVARAIFAHTFLNPGNQKPIERRALAAAPILRQWLGDEIAARRRRGETGQDYMGRLLARADLDDDGVRRTLGGMLVGSIDTTVTALAKILIVAVNTPPLRNALASAWNRGEDIYGLCLEALRRWPHNPLVLRNVAADTKLAGTTVRAGDRVALWTQAAMLDPEAFPDPGLIRPDRSWGSYLHFGGGLHPCAGRRINAQQLPLLVGPLLARGVRRNGALRWAGPFPDHLPIRLAEPA